VASLVRVVQWIDYCRSTGVLIMTQWLSACRCTASWCTWLVYVWWFI